MNIVIVDAIMKSVTLEKEKENRDSGESVIFWGPDFQNGKMLLVDGWRKCGKYFI